MAKKKKVMILFPDLTHNGKQYRLGEIEKSPTQYLLDAASEKTTQYHRDSKREIRICKFADEEEEIYDPYMDMEKQPAQIRDELDSKFTPELKILAKSLGATQGLIKGLDKVRLMRLIRFLRKL